MTLEQAKTKRDEILSNGMISSAQKHIQLMRLQAQLHRLYPEVELADLG
jgi:hypothetical protein